MPEPDDRPATTVPRRGMTALRRYQKLESRGLLRETPAAQLRDVVVNLGEASIVLSDPRSGVAVTHWSLPAIERINPGQVPAVWRPGPDAAETLEIDDTDMISALETVAVAIDRARPRPGRLRQAGIILTACAAVAVLVGWMPGAVMRRTAAILPAVTRNDIGLMVLDDLVRLTGPACAAPAGQAALDRLALRLFGPENTPKLTVVREGLADTMHLPGNRIVLSEALLVVPDTPDVAAGHVVAERLRMSAGDPVLRVLNHAGLWPSLRLLATGALDAGAVSGIAEGLLQAARPVIPDDVLLAAFAQAELPASPYAYALDPSGERTLPLIEADPFPSGPPRPVLPEADWVRLQDICSK
jgi:hypothetical protein